MTLENKKSKILTNLNNVYQTINTNLLSLDNDMKFLMGEITTKINVEKEAIESLQNQETNLKKDQLNILKESEKEAQAIQFREVINNTLEQESKKLPKNLEELQSLLSKTEEEISQLEKELKAYSEDFESKKALITREAEKYLKHFGISVKLDESFVVIKFYLKEEQLTIMLESRSKNSMVFKSCSEPELLKKVLKGNKNTVSVVLKKIVSEWIEGVEKS